MTDRNKARLLSGGHRGSEAEFGRCAEKWARAREFYKSDVASGFVRVQAELWAASLSDAGLREKFIPRIQAWNKIVSDAVRDALTTLEADGMKLPPPFSAGVIATWISQFWIGMEFADLLGAKDEQTDLRAALDAVQRLLETVDKRVQKKRPRRRKNGSA